MKTNRRPQTPKADKLNSRARAQVDRSGSNAAGPHRLKTDYTRKPKHRNRGWDES
jgi:hypothetical protein